MGFILYNANPIGNLTIDCTVRAISLFTFQPWEFVHDDLCMLSKVMYDMPSANRVWKRYLWMLGYRPNSVYEGYVRHYSVQDFCYEHPIGRYLITTDGHVVTVINGNYYDTWDSGKCVPETFWKG